jgi:hypothetical protein
LGGRARLVGGGLPAFLLRRTIDSSIFGADVGSLTVHARPRSVSDHIFDGEFGEESGQKVELGNNEKLDKARGMAYCKPQALAKRLTHLVTNSSFCPTFPSESPFSVAHFHPVKSE